MNSHFILNLLYHTHSLWVLLEVCIIFVTFTINEIFNIECGGKMHLREGEFSKAHTDFFEAFKNYDESGSRR